MSKRVVDTQEEVDRILRQSPGLTEPTYFTAEDIISMLNGKFIVYAQTGMEYYEAYALDPDVKLKSFIVETYQNEPKAAG